MITLREIKEKIEEIRNRDFEVEEMDFYDTKIKYTTLLRSAQLCRSVIPEIEDISKDQREELYEEIDRIMKKKLKNLNPDFTEDILNRIISGYKRGFVIYPMDILVIDDAVFHKEGVFDDFGSIYKIETFMFQGMKPYYSISDIYFTLDDFDLLSEDNKERLTKEDDMYTSKFISDRINSIYGANITKPTYELNTKTAFYGYGGLVSGEVHGVDTYINMKFDDIGRLLKRKEECDIRICIQCDDDITLYYVHQSFKNGEPVWSVENSSSDVWRLTEEALRLRNKGTKGSYHLTEKKKANN